MIRKIFRIMARTTLWHAFSPIVKIGLAVAIIGSLFHAIPTWLLCVSILAFAVCIVARDSTGKSVTQG